MRRLHLSLLALIAAVCLLPGTSWMPLIDRDEPRFAQATREMIQRDDWLIPYFNGEYRFDKPVMIYWLMRASVAVFGDSEFAVRVPSIVFSWLTAWVIYEMALLLALTPWRAWLAGVMWLTCLQVLIHGRLAVADMPMVFSVALTHLALLKLLMPQGQQGSLRLWRWILYFSLAFGFLTKGPIAWIVPLLTLLLMRWVFWRKSIEWGKLGAVWGLPLVALLIAAWGVPALLKTQGLFWQIGMGEHVVKRGVESFNNRWFLPFYYLLTSWLSLFPWAGWAVWAWQSSRRGTWQTSFLTAWFIAPFLVFSFYATQLPHYILPGFPAFFLLLAMGWNEKAKLPALAWVLLSTVLGLAGVVLWIGLTESFELAQTGLRWAVIGMGVALVGLTLGGYCLARNFKIVSVLCLIVLGLGFGVIGHGLKSVSPTKPLAEEWQSLPKDTLFYFRGYEEPGVIYYSNRRWAIESPSPQSNLEKPSVWLWQNNERRLEDFVKRRFLGQSPKDRATLLDAETARILEEQGYRKTPIQGVNLARISWMEGEVWLPPHSP